MSPAATWLLLICIVAALFILLGLGLGKAAKQGDEQLAHLDDIDDIDDDPEDVAAVQRLYTEGGW